jgi:hypothetical protein
MEELVINFGIWYVFFFIILILLFRKYIYSIFDPAIFIILVMASCLSLSLDSLFFWYIFLACIGFYFGVVTNGSIKRNTNSAIELKNFMLLEFFTLGVFLLYFLANIILYKDAKIPLFSDEVTTNKIAIFGPGSGWIRRIFFFSSFIPIGLFLLSILTKSKFKSLLYASLLIVFMILSILLGSKSGFLGVFYTIWLIYTQTNLWSSHNLTARNFIKGKIKYLLIFSIIIFVFIVFRETIDNPSFFWISLGFRLMEFGDVMLFYKIPFIREVFSNYNLFDFLRIEFNGILGLIRLDDYKQPLGYLMSDAYNGSSVSDVITGPNTVFLVRGHIFFGYIGGIVYCYLMGWLFSFLRKRILSYKITNIFVYAVLVFIFFNLDGLLREFNQYFSVFFDFFIYTFFIFIIALVITNYFKKIPIKINNKLE